MLQEINHESMLLLHLAGELSAADRAEAARMLDSDADLRAELERLDAAVQSFETGMAQLDSAPIPSDAAMVRQIGQAMRQRMAEQLGKAVSAPAAGSQPRYRWWAYPSAAAAVVAISLLSWWGHRPDSPQMLPIAKVAPAMPPEEASQLADALQKNFERTNLTEPKNSVAALDAAEDQIAELSRSQSQLLGFSDGNE